MTLVSWIGSKLGYRRSPDRADAALQLASEVIGQSRSLRAQLEPFAQESDPFASIVIKRHIATEYEDIVEIERTPRATP